jgi:hypothetical protein
MYDLFHRIPNIEVYQKITIFSIPGLMAINLDVIHEVRARIHAEDGMPAVSNAVTPAIIEKINDFIAISLL